jgi:hypothetical protein
MAYEDFTTYTEVDTEGKVTVNQYSIFSTATLSSDDSYVYKDFGAGHFTQNLHHRFKTKAVTTSINGTREVWILSNELGNRNALSTYLVIVWQYPPFSFAIGEVISGVIQDSDSTTSMSKNVYYYIDVLREDSSLTVTVYSDSDFTVLVDTLQITIANTSYRYIYPSTNYYYAEGYDAYYVSGYTDNLEIFEEAAEYTEGLNPGGMSKVMGVM